MKFASKPLSALIARTSVGLDLAQNEVIAKTHLGRRVANDLLDGCIRPQLERHVRMIGAVNTDNIYNIS